MYMCVLQAATTELINEDEGKLVTVFDVAGLGRV
jgi:hypothetical protein